MLPSVALHLEGSQPWQIAAIYPERTRCAIIHEVPFENPPSLEALIPKSDEEITATCQMIFRAHMIEQEVNNGPQKWDALGKDYHGRLAKNYVTWIRNYANAVEIGGNELASEPENLRRRSIFWTVGALNASENGVPVVWKSNIEKASAAGLSVNTTRLNSLHFPALTVPDDMAGWIIECIGQVKD